ncbi:hypothetical protein OS493_009261 [Desmophyllum pertusum]|uniref:Uncharacterized protein n=1 Tax=Desmophyllum pertusum TaxID=174260 RepID=A0A9X0CUH3_9CNID|nr:hypothetical protein OS493_009261 [Desmophyllum pertusum]
MSKILACCLILLGLSFQQVYTVYGQLSAPSGPLGQVGKRVSGYKDAAGHDEARSANYLDGNRLYQRESADTPAGPSRDAVDAYRRNRDRDLNNH